MVTLNFKPEDLKAPEFTESFYTAATITDHTVIFWTISPHLSNLMLQEKSLVTVSAKDGDANINNAITYELLEVPQCKFDQQFFC